jgi:hypothetical protein
MLDASTARRAVSTVETLAKFDGQLTKVRSARGVLPEDRGDETDTFRQETAGIRVYTNLYIGNQSYS